MSAGQGTDATGPIPRITDVARAAEGEHAGQPQLWPGHEGGRPLVPPTPSVPERPAPAATPSPAPAVWGGSPTPLSTSAPGWIAPPEPARPYPGAATPPAATHGLAAPPAVPRPTVGTPGPLVQPTPVAVPAAGAAPATAVPSRVATDALPAAPPPPPPAAPVRQPAPRPTVPQAAPLRRTAATAVPARGGVRRARLVVRTVDPWSVLKLSLIASLCLVIVGVAAVSVLYVLFRGAGVFDQIAKLLDTFQRNGGSSRSYFSATDVIGVSAIVFAVNALLFTALATLGAFLYNLCSSFTGGIEVTLSERG